MTDETELPLPGESGDGTPIDGTPIDGATDMAQRGADDAPLVTAILNGDQDQFGVLYDRWFDSVFDLAYRIVRDTATASAVAQDTFLNAWRNLGRLEDPHAFDGWLLRITRTAALNRAHEDQRVRPADDPPRALDQPELRPEDTIGAQDDPARIVADASYVALLWSSADALADRDREVVDLSLRHGMTPAEIGDIVGMNRDAANQLVHRVRQRFATAVGARVLWRDGTPRCAALRAELVADDIETFDGDAVRVTDKHANSCTECSERRRTKLPPDKMFAAIPIMAMPSLRAKVAAALVAAGAPMNGSHALDGGIPTDPGAGSSTGSGGGGSDDGLPVPAAADDDGGGGGKRRLRVLLLVAGVLGLILATILTINAVAKDRSPKKIAVTVPSSTTSTTRTSTTSTSSTSTTSTSTTTSTTTVPVTVPPTVPPPAPATTTTTTIPIRVTFDLAPDTTTTPYLTTAPDKPPMLTWSVTGVTRVKVYDNVHVFESTKALGSQAVCPGTNTGPQCEAAAGTYTYALDAYNASNILVLHRTVTLTITEP